MNKLKNVCIKPLSKSNYIKPVTMNFTLGGKKKKWDILTGHNGVNIILYNVTRNVLIFIKQFRPEIYIRSIPKDKETESLDVNQYPAENGITIELCGGIVDKDIPLTEVAAEKILNKCNYKITPKLLEKVITYHSGVGIMGRMQTLYYCEVTDEMKLPADPNADDKLIHSFEMTIPEVQKYISNENMLSPSSLLFAIYWFLNNKYKT